MVTETHGEWRILLADTGMEMFFVKLLKTLGILVTSGLAYPWLMDWYCHKWADRLIIDGRRVRYTGTVAGILRTWLKVWFFSSITLTIYWWLRGRRNILRYMDSHIEWA